MQQKSHILPNLVIDMLLLMAGIIRAVYIDEWFMFELIVAGIFIAPAIIIHNIITLIIATKKKNEKLNTYSFWMLSIFGLLFIFILLTIASMKKIGG